MLSLLCVKGLACFPDRALMGTVGLPSGITRQGPGIRHGKALTRGSGPSPLCGLSLLLCIHRIGAIMDPAHWESQRANDRNKVC